MNERDSCTAPDNLRFIITTSGRVYWCVPQALSHYNLTVLLIRKRKVCHYSLVFGESCIFSIFENIHYNWHYQSNFIISFDIP